MILQVSRLGIFLAMTLPLAACLEDPALTGAIPPAPTAAPAPPAAPVISDEVRAAYAASKDGNFTIPAVPVEKLKPDYTRQTVAYTSDQPVGTIIVDPANRFLYLITGKDQAMRYGISVGRAGFEWHGEAIVSNRRNWPTWTPPPEMIERDPKLEKWKNGQPGGPSNPLGARALYLTTNGRDYGYRIHGTPDWWSIGRNASSGCIRMIHQDVIDLEQRVATGAKVIVLTKDGKIPTGLKLPPPQPRKTPKPAAVVAVAPAVVPADAPLQSVPETPVSLTPEPSVQAPAPTIAPVVVAPATPPQTAVTPVVVAPVTPAPATTVPVAPVPSVPAATVPVVAVPAPTVPAPTVPAATAAHVCQVPLVNGVCPTP